MLHHPGQLVFLQCIFQLISDLHWYTSITELSFLSSNKTFCTTVGAISIASSTAFFSYLLALTVEIKMKLKNSTKVAYSRRNLSYHLYTVLISLAFSVTGVVTGEFGISDVNTCSYEDGKLGRYIYSIFILLNVSVIWVILFGIFQNLRKNLTSLMRSYVLVVISVSLTISIGQLMEVVGHLDGHKVIYKRLGIIFGSMTGTCIALARLCNKPLLQRLYYRLFLKRHRIFADPILTGSMSSAVSMEEIESEEVTFFGELFDNATKRINYQILSLLFLRFEEPESEKFVIDSGNNFADYKFSEDFIEKAVDSEYGNILYQKSKFQIGCLKQKVLREYMNKDFEKIRQECKIGFKDIQVSMMLHMNNFNLSKIEGGRSAAFIYTTFDEKFVIKTINKAECKLLISMFDKYFNRIINCPESRLIRILGLFRLMPENQDFIIMENVLPNKENAVIFDLKGSITDRIVKNLVGVPKGVVLKDQNFLECRFKIRLTDDEKKKMLKALAEDFLLLCSQNVMDYSVLAGFYEESPKNVNRYMIKQKTGVVSLGVIDILQEYNLSKISEHSLKKLYKKNRTSISVTNANNYYRRFIEFTDSLFADIDT